MTNSFKIPLGVITRLIAIFLFIFCGFITLGQPINVIISPDDIDVCSGALSVEVEIVNTGSDDIMPRSVLTMQLPDGLNYQNVISGFDDVYANDENSPVLVIESGIPSNTSWLGYFTINSTCDFVSELEDETGIDATFDYYIDGSDSRNTLFEKSNSLTGYYTELSIVGFQDFYDKSSLSQDRNALEGIKVGDSYYGNFNITNTGGSNGQITSTDRVVVSVTKGVGLDDYELYLRQSDGYLKLISNQGLSTTDEFVYVINNELLNNVFGETVEPNNQRFERGERLDFELKSTHSECTDILKHEIKAFWGCQDKYCSSDAELIKPWKVTKGLKPRLGMSKEYTKRASSCHDGLEMDVSFFVMNDDGVGFSGSAYNIQLKGTNLIEAYITVGNNEKELNVVNGEVDFSQLTAAVGALNDLDDDGQFDDLEEGERIDIKAIYQSSDGQKPLLKHNLQFWASEGGCSSARNLLRQNKGNIGFNGDLNIDREESSSTTNGDSFSAIFDSRSGVTLFEGYICSDQPVKTVFSAPEGVLIQEIKRRHRLGEESLLKEGSSPSNVVEVERATEYGAFYNSDYFLTLKSTTCSVGEEGVIDLLTTLDCNGCDTPLVLEKGTYSYEIEKCGSDDNTGKVISINQISLERTTFGWPPLEPGNYYTYYDLFESPTPVKRVDPESVDLELDVCMPKDHFRSEVYTVADKEYNYKNNFDVTIEYDISDDVDDRDRTIVSKVTLSEVVVNGKSYKLKSDKTAMNGSVSKGTDVIDLDISFIETELWDVTVEEGDEVRYVFDCTLDDLDGLKFDAKLASLNLTSFNVVFERAVDSYSEQTKLGQLQVFFPYYTAYKEYLLNRFRRNDRLKYTSKATNYAFYYSLFHKKHDFDGSFEFGTSVKPHKPWKNEFRPLFGIRKVKSEFPVDAGLIPNYSGYYTNGIETKKFSEEKQLVDGKIPSDYFPLENNLYRLWNFSNSTVGEFVLDQGLETPQVSDDVYIHESLESPHLMPLLDASHFDGRTLLIRNNVKYDLTKTNGIGDGVLGLPNLALSVDKFIYADEPKTLFVERSSTEEPFYPNELDVEASSIVDLDNQEYHLFLNVQGPQFVVESSNGKAVDYGGAEISKQALIVVETSERLKFSRLNVKKDRYASGFYYMSNSEPNQKLDVIAGGFSNSTLSVPDREDNLLELVFDYEGCLSGDELIRVAFVNGQYGLYDRLIEDLPENSYPPGFDRQRNTQHLYDWEASSIEEFIPWFFGDRAEYTHQYIRVPKPRLVASVNQLDADGTDLCSPAGFEVTIPSSKYSDLHHLLLDIKLPEEIALDNVGFVYNGTSYSASIGIAESNTLVWDISQALIDNNISEGELPSHELGDVNNVTFQFELTPTCESNLLRTLDVSLRGETECGQDLNYRNRQLIRLRALDNLEMTLESDLVPVQGCNESGELTVSLVNNRTVATKAQNVSIHIPNGFSYIEGSLSNESINELGEEVIDGGVNYSFQLPVGFLSSEESKSFTIGIEATGSYQSDAYLFEGRAIQVIDGLQEDCSEACNVTGLTALAELELTVPLMSTDVKFDLTVQGQSGYQSYVFCNEDVEFDLSFELNTSQHHGYRLLKDGEVVSSKVLDEDLQIINLTFEEEGDVGEYTLLIAAKNTNCYIPVGSKSILRNSDVVDAGEDQVVCQNSVDLFGDSTEPGVWYLLSGPSSVRITETGDRSATVMLEGGAFGDYVFEFASFVCEELTDQVTIEYHNPSINISTGGCDGNYTLTATVNSSSIENLTFAWYKVGGELLPSDRVESTGTTSTLTTSELGEYRVVATGSDQNSCAIEATEQLSENSGIEVNLVAQDGSDINCIVSETALAVSVDTDEIYEVQWFEVVDDENRPIRGANEPIFYGYVGDGPRRRFVGFAGEYTVGISIGECEYLSDDIAVVDVVNIEPIEDVITCVQSVALEAEGNFESGVWSLVSSPNSDAAIEDYIDDESDLNESTLVLSLVDGIGTYEFEFTTTAGCSDVQLSEAVTVHYWDYSGQLGFSELSGIHYEDENRAVVCEGSEYTMNVYWESSNADAPMFERSHIWYQDDNRLTSPPSVGPGGGLYDPMDPSYYSSSDVDTEFRVTVDYNGCTFDDYVNIEEDNSLSTLTPEIVGDLSPDFCPVEVRELTITRETDLVAYQWYDGDALLVGETMTSLQVSEPGEYRVEITRRYDNGSTCQAFTQALELGYKIYPQISIFRITNTSCRDSQDGEARLFISNSEGDLPEDGFNYSVYSSAGALISEGVSFEGPVLQQHEALVGGLGVGSYYLETEHPTSGCTARQNFTIGNGGPYAVIETESLSCDEEMSAGNDDRSYGVEFRIEASRPRSGGLREFEYAVFGLATFEGQEEELITQGRASFGDQMEVSLPYDRRYEVRVRTQAGSGGLGAPPIQGCEESFPISFTRARMAASLSGDNLIYICDTDEGATATLSGTLTANVLNDDLNEQINITLYKDGVELSDNSVQGVTSPYDLTGLQEGNYTAEVSSADSRYTSCTQTVGFRVIETSLRVADTDIVDVKCNGESNGEASVYVSGSSGNVTYEWRASGSSTIISTSSQAFGLSVGTYEVLISDRYCQDVLHTVEIDEPDELADVSMGDPEDNCTVSAELGSNGVGGGTSPYRFEWYHQREVTDPFDRTTTTVEDRIYTDEGVTVLDGQILSTISTTLMENGEAYRVIVYDANECEVAMPDPKVITFPADPRNYKLTFRWTTHEQEIQDGGEEDIDETIITFQGMTSGELLIQQAEECVVALSEVSASLIEDACLNVDPKDELSIAYNTNQYHYTLYYYDRAGRLTSTVPPAGVNLVDPASNRTVPTAHALKTKYYYDHIGQLVQQESPDGGLTTFKYNAIGQLRYSQNAKQRGDKGKGQEEEEEEEKRPETYSYTKYDNLGRIVEVGQAVGTYKTADVEANPSVEVTEEVTRTYYTVNSGETYRGMAQEYLRNRVSYTETLNKGKSPSDEDAEWVSTYYSYDPHGNVKWLKQSIPGLGDHGVSYEYDLISGNVKQVAYDEGSRTGDQFYHRYEYDEDNRIAAVYTSLDGSTWERDAAYSYYDHGPLQRVLIGHDNVQGVDYAYTLQGWLKAINAQGEQGQEEEGIAGDVFQMQLDYFTGDFQHESSPFDNQDDGDIKDLYNGNIARWSFDHPTVKTGPFANVTKQFDYTYDELNRIIEANFNDPTTTDNELHYDSEYSYDPNGNILSLVRNISDIDGNAKLMDNLDYTYYESSNQLQFVEDKLDEVDQEDEEEDEEEDNDGEVVRRPPPVTDADIAVDIDGVHGYAYDAIGNLIEDDAEGVTIDWTVTGKVAEVTHESGEVTSYQYDASGNRVQKSQINADGSLLKDTYYVRDASGNVMAVYEDEGKTYSPVVRELPIYGSDRLGLVRREGVMNAIIISTHDTRDGDPEGPLYYVEPDASLTLEPGFTFEATEGEDLVITTDPSILMAGLPTPSKDATHATFPGWKTYELKDHLGNVRATITDVRASGDVANVLSATSYYPFGMEMPYQSKNLSNYRYGFNGKEKDQEGEFGELTNYDYGFRIYNPAIAKFLSVDPLTKEYPWYTPYQFAGNKPIGWIDLDGLEEFRYRLDMSSGGVVRDQGDRSLYDFSHPGILDVKADAEFDDRTQSRYRLDFVNKKGFSDWKLFHTFDDMMSFDTENELGYMSRLYAAAEMGLITNPNGIVTQALPKTSKSTVVKPQVKKTNSVKVKQVTYTKAELTSLRNKAVRNAWKQEKSLVENTGRGTRNWTKAETVELKQNGKVKGYAGHHINDVNSRPDLAGNSNNIEFLQTGNKTSGGARKGSEHYLKHNTSEGRKIETTSGPLVDRSY